MLRQTLCLGESRKQDMDNEEVTSNHSQPKTNGVGPQQPNGATNGVVSRRYITPEMCVYCFDVLIAHLNHANSPKTPHFPNDEFPLFVTWKTGRDRKLRGCMGTFTARKLHRGLAEYALTSSIRDSRFQPVSLDEVSRLECSVSLLTNFERAKDYSDWEIGVHGIQIEFNDGGHMKSATYLPEVAADQGWSKIEAIDSLLRKGGYKGGKVTEDYRRTIRLTRYQTEKCIVTYEEYNRLRRRHKPY